MIEQIIEIDLSKIDGRSNVERYFRFIFEHINSDKNIKKIIFSNKNIHLINYLVNVKKFVITTVDDNYIGFELSSENEKEFYIGCNLDIDDYDVILIDKLEINSYKLKNSNDLYYVNNRFNEYF